MVYHRNSYSHVLVRDGQDTTQLYKGYNFELPLHYCCPLWRESCPQQSKHIPFPAHLASHAQVKFQRAVSPAWHEAEPHQISLRPLWKDDKRSACMNVKHKIDQHLSLLMMPKSPKHFLPSPFIFPFYLYAVAMFNFTTDLLLNATASKESVNGYHKKEFISNHSPLIGHKKKQSVLWPIFKNISDAFLSHSWNCGVCLLSFSCSGVWLSPVFPVLDLTFPCFCTLE